MIPLNFSLYSWENGAFIMIGVFALVIIAIMTTVILMISSKNKKND
jgi:hypothetical protein